MELPSHGLDQPAAQVETQVAFGGVCRLHREVGTLCQRQQCHRSGLVDPAQKRYIQDTLGPTQGRDAFFLRIAQIDARVPVLPVKPKGSTCTSLIWSISSSWQQFYRQSSASGTGSANGDSVAAARLTKWI
jgi:hypothetical protein